ncbi:hypothetical protein GCM10027612_48260 [Microbispora bryophytorum subsp. camponoti]
MARPVGVGRGHNAELVAVRIRQDVPCPAVRRQAAGNLAANAFAITQLPNGVTQSYFASGDADLRAVTSPSWIRRCAVGCRSQRRHEEVGPITADQVGCSLLPMRTVA